MVTRRQIRSLGLARARQQGPDPNLSVFINCPFDADYIPLLDALVFTVVCCGFQPRTADELELSDEPRMARIVHAIFTSCYSIHDLSRCKGEGRDLLARFNMPFELGMVVVRKFVSDVLGSHSVDANGKRKKLPDDLADLARQHRWLVLVPEGHDSDRFVSDLGGYDLRKYDGKIDTIVARVMGWFLAMPGAVGPLKPSQVLDALPEFRAEQAALRAEWADQVPWGEVLEAATRCAPRPGD